LFLAESVYSFFLSWYWEWLKITFCLSKYSLFWQKWAKNVALQNATLLEQVNVHCVRWYIGPVMPSDASPPHLLLQFFYCRLSRIDHLFSSAAKLICRLCGHHIVRYVFLLWVLFSVNTCPWFLFLVLGHCSEDPVTSHVTFHISPIVLRLLLLLLFFIYYYYYYYYYF
jgi:hypothetical protein